MSRVKNKFGMCRRIYSSFYNILSLKSGVNNKRNINFDLLREAIFIRQSFPSRSVFFGKGKEFLRYEKI